MFVQRQEANLPLAHVLNDLRESLEWAGRVADQSHRKIFEQPPTVPIHSQPRMQQRRKRWVRGQPDILGIGREGWRIERDRYRLSSRGQEVCRSRAVVREGDRYASGIADGLSRKLSARKRQRRMSHRTLNPAAALSGAVVKHALAVSARQQCRTIRCRARRHQSSRAQPRELDRFYGNRPPRRTAPPSMLAPVLRVKRQDSDIHRFSERLQAPRPPGPQRPAPTSHS